MLKELNSKPLLLKAIEFPGSTECRLSIMLSPVSIPPNKIKFSKALCEM